MGELSNLVSANPAVAIVVSSTLAYVVWSYFTSDKGSTSKLPLVPLRPGGLPLMGNIEFAGEKSNLFKQLGGQITRFKVFGQSIVVFPAFDYADELYKMEGTNIRGGSSIATFKPLFGEASLLNVHGEEAKAIRRILLPVFRPSDLIKVHGQIQGILAPAFKKLSEKDSFSVGPELEAFAFILGMAFIGVEYEKSQHQHLVDQTHNILGATLVFPIDLGKYSTFGRGMNARRDLIALARSSVKERRRKIAAGESVKNDLLQRLLNSRDDDGNAMEEMMLLNTLLIFILGSFDTTCSSMTSVILNMCRYQHVQEKVHAHIREVLTDDEYHGRVEIAEERWAQFEYLDQVIYETQRFTPPMNVSSSRIAEKEFELGGKYRIEKGTVLMWDTLSPTRMEKYWPNPNEFDPERFNRSNPKYRKNVAYLNTFGGGKRKCPGMGFAQLELNIFMTLLMRDYKVEFADPSAPEPELVYPFTFLLESPLHVKFTKREK